MAPPDDRSQASQDVARAIIAGFDRRYRAFRAASAHARLSFEQGDWAGLREVSRQSTDAYDRQVRQTVEEIRERWPGVHAEADWPAIKVATIALLMNHQQPELAETFFNSVTCRLLDRRYFHNEYLFWRPAVSTENIEGLQPTWRTYLPAANGLRACLKQMVIDLQLVSDWEDLERDLAAVVRAFLQVLPHPLEVQQGLQVQVLSSLFFRNRSATLVGQVLNGPDQIPFAVPIRKNTKNELYLDTVLLERAELGTLFSLARSYFLVDMEVPSAFVGFLRAIFPEKPPAELYTALGLHKQGKTLFYRQLFEHLRHSADQFVVAPGVRGMVMLVFTLPSFPYVFKLIRDHFEPPKDTDRAKVMEQYRFVKLHDRVGRMADTLEYSDVAFPVSRFAPALLEELEQRASALLERDGDRLVIKHLYIERRMTPLDVALHGAGPEKTKALLFEYGQALRELASANVFPGDLLLKNFGVTRFGRVVFYDYDEIAPLEECTFRFIPKPRDDEDAWRAEPSFFVGPNDIFPEEFPRFLFPDERLKSQFLEMHGDLCAPVFWRKKQEQLRAGLEDDVVPYLESRRFPHAHG